MGIHRRYWFLISNVCGALILLWSSHDFFEMMRGDRLGGSFCNFNSYWNCDRASLSILGSWQSIPTSILGAIWFFVIAVLGFSPARCKLKLRALLLLGALMTFCFAAFLIFKLQTGCLICFLTYIFVATSVYLGWNLHSQPDGPNLDSKSLAIIFLTGLIAIGAYTLWSRSRLDDRILDSEFTEWFKKKESIPLLSPLQKGAAEAPVTVVEFSDFGCPFCAKAVEVVIPFLSQQPDVKFVFYPFPLDSSCNSLVDRVIHPYSCDWSKIVICAQSTGEQWKIHDAIFAQTNEGDRLSDPRKELSSLSANSESLLKCMDDPATNQTIKQLIEVGQSLNIERTPTFFVNGRRYEGLLPIPLVRRLLEELRQGQDPAL